VESSPQTTIAEDKELGENPGSPFPRFGDWQFWAVGAAGAIFGTPYLGAETAHAAWSEVMRSLKTLHSR